MTEQTSNTSPHIFKIGTILIEGESTTGLSKVRSTMNMKNATNSPD